MTSRQCEIAAESYAACLLAQAGYERDGVRSSNLTQDINFVIITNGKTIKDRV